MVIGKLLLDEDFDDVLKALHRKNIELPSESQGFEPDFGSFVYPKNGKLVTPIDKVEAVTFDPKKGQKTYESNKKNILAYDESINKYFSLEGIAYLITHSIVKMDKKYNPTTWTKFFFYTRSKALAKDEKSIVNTKDPEMQSKKDFIRDKIKLLLNFAPSTSYLFIDGPLIGGDVYTIMIKAIKSFDKKQITPVFFVKNSNSNLVTDNIPSLKYKYNSDLHWASKFLNKGQRTNFFVYRDKIQPKNAKVFCYVKPFKVSPQRVEFPVSSFDKIKDIDSLMNMIYYLMIAQGDIKNPQIRPIAIAEAYARETIKLFDLQKMIKKINLVPTINQGRF